MDNSNSNSNSNNSHEGCYFNRLLEYTSDSVEFYPSFKNSTLFTAGTYQIEQGDTEYKERRKGRLYLFDIEKDNKVKELQSIDFNSGILDMKWTHHNNISQQYENDAPLLGVVMSRGELNVYRLNAADQEQGERRLELVCRNDVSLDPSILTLSLDWRTDNKEIVTSYSDGSLALFDVDGGAVTNRWIAHDYEAWICAYNYHNTSMVFSGGDDCKFKVWDTRTIEAEDGGRSNSSGATPIFTKRCDMGVTSIHCHPALENIVAVGSYDECVRIWDLRSMKQPLTQTDSLGGGVWRIKWSPSDNNHLVTACMGGGFHTLSSEDGTFTDLSIKSSYQGPHQSIAYGVDWSYTNSSSTDKQQYIGCCSFYDRCLSVWTP
ncbi:hypothetical protein CYY_003076 [Polysphondylium violaceum]|uniref:methylated diphthine methylhydrolase n=1 Tax=Polysphondylium violaceum TaxID=133409 RepID=A0A8J4PX63_9MYCE|nr:hypothetical protein CYY_003076 [Polysphondylium violaceum]